MRLWNRQRRGIRSGGERLRKFIHMNYRKLLSGRYETELKKISMLKHICLNFQSYPIVWRKMPSAPIDGWLKKDQYSRFRPYIDLQHVSEPVVYYYEVTKGESTKIWTQLYEYKNQKKRTCPEQKIFTDSSILYVGSETNSLARRTVEHMGLAHINTGGLQLLHWAPKIGVKLCLHYSLIDEAHTPAIRHVEATLANYLNPLVGRREK
jgi:hypothetical protein